MNGLARPVDTLTADPEVAGSFRGGGLRALIAGLQPGDAAAYRHLLIMRFVVVNMVALAMLGAAWVNGWVGMVMAGDITQLVTVIALVFLAGLAECGRRVVQTSVELDRVQTRGGRLPPHLKGYLQTVRGGRDGQSRAMVGSALKLRLASRISTVRHVANSLVFLGLIGTVIGFIIALSGVDPSAAGDVDAIGPMVSTLISGMSVALYTTLVGAILNVWLMLNYRLLEGGTVRLLTAMVELGERDE